jgi:hypothetical protein
MKLLPNIVVLVAFKLSILNLVDVDNLPKLVLYAYITPLPIDVDVIVVTVPCTESSAVKTTVNIL